MATIGVGVVVEDVAPLSEDLRQVVEQMVAGVAEVVTGSRRLAFEWKSFREPGSAPATHRCYVGTESYDAAAALIGERGRIAFMLRDMVRTVFAERRVKDRVEIRVLNEPAATPPPPVPPAGPLGAVVSTARGLLVAAEAEDPDVLDKAYDALEDALDHLDRGAP